MDFAAISNTLLEIFYIIIGIMMLNTAVLTLKDKNHKAKIGTALFWALLGIIFIFGPSIPPALVGATLVVIAVLTLTKQVKPGTVKALDEKFIGIMYLIKKSKNKKLLQYCRSFLYVLIIIAL